jgi:hypothetical protein
MLSFPSPNSACSKGLISLNVESKASEVNYNGEVYLGTCNGVLKGSCKLYLN